MVKICEHTLGDLYSQFLKFVPPFFKKFSPQKYISFHFSLQEWTNYKLAHVNLSHNRLPAITREILRGTTRTLISLDLSHNQISDVKPNLLHHLAVLEDLDLSHNSLHFLEPVSLGPPPAIKTLNLEDNSLRKFPTDVLPLAKNLTFINLQRNRIRHFAPEFGDKIETNGSRILLGGNPLNCDCMLIPLQRYFTREREELSNRSEAFFRDFDNFECILSNSGGADGGEERVKLSNVEESRLICDYSDDPLAKRVEIGREGDVEIRTVLQDGRHVQIRCDDSSPKSTHF